MVIGQRDPAVPLLSLSVAGVAGAGRGEWRGAVAAVCVYEGADAVSGMWRAVVCQAKAGLPVTVRAWARSRVSISAAVAVPISRSMA